MNAQLPRPPTDADLAAAERLLPQPSELTAYCVICKAVVRLIAPERLSPTPFWKGYCNKGHTLFRSGD